MEQGAGFGVDYMTFLGQGSLFGDLAKLEKETNPALWGKMKRRSTKQLGEKKRLFINMSDCSLGVLCSAPISLSCEGPVRDRLSREKVRSSAAGKVVMSCKIGVAR